MQKKFPVDRSVRLSVIVRAVEIMRKNGYFSTKSNHLLMLTPNLHISHGNDVIEYDVIINMTNFRTVWPRKK